ncbi:RNA-directed DNA polymerase, eukaryota [Tanacetum coccineum]
MPLYAKFPRLFALDLNKDCSVADKLNNSVELSFRRAVRGGIEQHQMSDLVSMLESIVLSSSNDRWVCGLSNDGDFKVKDIRIFLDDLFLPHSEPTRWIKAMPIKINIFAWRARKDCLPTRMNLVQRDINIDSVLCPVCVTNDEDAHHLFFRCDLAQHVLRRLCRWWDLDTYGWSSFHDWLSWFSTIRSSSLGLCFFIERENETVFLMLEGSKVHLSHSSFLGAQSQIVSLEFFGQWCKDKKMMNSAKLVLAGKGVKVLCLFEGAGEEFRVLSN